MNVLAVALLMAPFAREPLGEGAPDGEPDALRRRVFSLLAGEPRASGAVVAVPLYARTPSEAAVEPGHASWPPESLAAWELVESGRLYLRLRNVEPSPVFVPAGSVFGKDGFEVCTLRDAILAPDFSGLVPAARFGTRPPRPVLDFTGTLPATAMGPLLLGVGPPAWLPGGTLEGTARIARVRSVAGRLLRDLDGLRDGMESTAVGAVFFVGGRIEGAHVYSSNALFARALPDL
ncbi:MAG: hypothetical protein ACREID_05165, partial [Planctomycetota bacterium]